MYDIFRRQVKRRLIALHIDQRELARRIDMNESTVSRYLQGHREPTLRVISLMADALECSPAYLVTDTIELI